MARVREQVRTAHAKTWTEQHVRDTGLSVHEVDLLWTTKRKPCILWRHPPGCACTYPVQETEVAA